MSDTSFPDDIERLLAQERNRPDESAATLGRLRERLSFTLGSLDAPTEDAPEDTGSPEPRGEAPQATGMPSATSAAAKFAYGKLAIVALGAFGAGAATGAKWQESRTPVPAVASIVAPAPLPPSALRPTPEVVAPAPVPSSSGIDVSSLPVAKPATPPATDTNGSRVNEAKDSLAAERTLIDVARTASSRGKMAEASSALDEHATRFPRGALSEEREGLRIQVLLAQGRTTEARERAARFRKNFPTSLLLPAIDAQLGAAPANTALP